LIDKCHLGHYDPGRFVTPHPALISSGPRHLRST
jgi:hypothetical protein